MSGLKDKASKLNFSNLPGAVPSPATDGAPLTRPKTAPGLMMAQAVEQRSELLRENDDLKAKVRDLTDQAAQAEEYREELKAWDGAHATRMLDPKLIAWSAWANRNEANFTAADFQELKEEIASAGGNVQAIKVRPLKPGGEHQYEVVFGHRRHRACLELGLPVKAEIDSISDVELFVEMDRENRGRKNLSAWEQGASYLMALEKGLFPSARKLSDATGVDLSQVGKALAIAKLPPEVVQAFPSPLDLQFRWAKPLSDQHEADPDGLISRAKKARALGPDRTAKHVLDVLLGAGSEQSRNQPQADFMFERDGKREAKLVFDRKGRAVVTFESPSIGAAHADIIKAAIQGILDKAAKSKK